MMELTIKDKVFQFKFGVGFMKEINKKITRIPNPDTPEVKQNVGLQFAVAGLMDGDVEKLVEVLDIANKTEKPRVTINDIYDYIDDENTNIDALFAEVLDFLRQSNATKKITAAVAEMVETERAKLEAQNK